LYEIASLWRLVNTEWTVRREQENRTDYVVYEDSSPVCYYEAKSYFKPNEKLNRGDISQDLKKLAVKYRGDKTSRCYFPVIGFQRKIAEITDTKLGFIKSRFSGKSKSWEDYEIKPGDHVRLRPSRKEVVGRSFVLT